METKKKSNRSQIFNKVDLEKGCELYVANCKRRGLSIDTIRYYEEVSNELMKCIHYTTPLTSITVREIDYFVEQQREVKKVNDNTINTYLNGIRAMVNFWAEQGYMEGFKIVKIKVDDTIPITFTDQEINRLLRQPDFKECSFLELECWVLCNLLFATGLRNRTIINLKVDDVDLDNNLIYCQKLKDRRPTPLPLATFFNGIMRRYLSVRAGQDLGHDFLFVNTYGEQLTKDSISRVLNRYYRSRGVGKTGVHIWRHSFASSYIKAGGSALKLQAALTHKTLDMTKKYVHLYGEDIRDEEFNPLQRYYAEKGQDSSERTPEAKHKKKRKKITL